MAKKSNYPRDISIVSAVFIFLIIFLAIVNLYIGTQLRKTFLNSQQEKIYSIARICGYYLNNPDSAKALKLISESFNIGRLIISDSLDRKIYDSAISVKIPGIIFDETKKFSKLPAPGDIMQVSNDIVYHNPQPDFYLYLFNLTNYATIDNVFRWHLIYITLSLVFISFLGFFLLRNLFLPMQYVAGVARKYGIEMKKEDFVSTTFGEIFNKMKEKEKELLELSAYIAHEFRNSLATITGLAHLIEKGKKEPSEIIKECNIMDGLIKSLIEYARPVKLMKTEFELSTLIEEVIKKANIPDEIKVEKNYKYQGKIFADYELMSSAIINILKNSVEAMGSDGKIRITTDIEEDSVLISIADTGKGIQSDMIKNIFSPFYSGKKEGTGLGLAFVKKVIDIHNGKITVDSKVGRGTEFLIKIPLNP
ncbi:MAG: ATP-binding protein [candidate division WOR-3 bacterium]